MGCADAFFNSDSDGYNLLYQVTEMAGFKPWQGGATIFSVLSACQNIYGVASVTEEYLNEMPFLSVFYTTHFYDSSGDNDHYYTRIDDPGMIKLIQDWSRIGIRAVYDYDVTDEDKSNDIDIYTLLKTKEHSIIDGITNNVGEKYTKEEIEKAWNTVLEGYGINKDTYQSIMNIPPELLLECVNQINLYNGDVDSVQYKINEKRSSHA